MLNQVFKLLEEDHTKHISSHINWAEQIHVPFSKKDQHKSVYSDPTIESLLMFLQPKIEKVYGKELIPSYSFWRTYFKNQCLPPHKDREACEVSVSLCIDASDKKNIWGMYIDGLEYKTQTGEAVIYKGIEQEHWRNDLEYNWHRQVFLHYIEKGGKYDPKWRFDGRENLYVNTEIIE